jgi:lipid A 3-O-deacylase
MRVSQSTIGVCAGLLALGVFIAAPASAQVVLGSPGDPPHVALGAGAFDITPSHGNHSRTAAEVRGEYRFGDVAWFIAPFVGLSCTSDGAFYGYGGFGFDVNLAPNLVLTPNVAVGYFARGSGTNLGSATEFRSGGELAWRMPDATRIGIAVHHISNAGLGKHNPGAQTIVVNYSIPMR